MSIRYSLIGWLMGIHWKDILKDVIVEYLLRRMCSSSVSSTIPANAQFLKYCPIIPMHQKTHWIIVFLTWLSYSLVLLVGALYLQPHASQWNMEYLSMQVNMCFEGEFTGYCSKATCDNSTKYVLICVQIS